MHAALGIIPSTVVIKDRLNNQRIYSTYIHTSICNLKRLKSLVIQKVDVKVSITYDIILSKQSNLYNTKCCKDRENQELSRADAEVSTYLTTILGNSLVQSANMQKNMFLQSGIHAQK